MSYTRKTLYDRIKKRPWDELKFLDSCDEIAKINYYDDISAIAIQVYWDKKFNRIIVYDNGPYLSMNGSLTLREVINGLGYEYGDICVDKWYDGDKWVKNNSILDYPVSHAPVCYISINPFQVYFSDEDCDILPCKCLLSCSCP